MHFLASSGHCRFPEITLSLFDCLPEVKSPVNHSKKRIEFFYLLKIFATESIPVGCVPTTPLQG